MPVCPWVRQRRYDLARPGWAKDFTITAESTSFRFTGDHTTWAVYAAQGNYDGGEVPLSKVGRAWSGR